MRRTRLLALVTLALINVCTLVAGIAVTRMLPGRLAALRIPYVASGAPAAPGPALAPGGQDGPLPTAAGLRTALSGALGSAAIGGHVVAIVTDPLTGQVLLSRNGDDPAEPASTEKIATATAAIDVLGGARRFTTRVVQTGPGQIVLVGGGDPMLAVSPYQAGGDVKPATLAALATATARTLRAQGRTSVQVGYDTSLYSGPGFAPGWPATYVTTGNTTQIVALEVDQGKLTGSGAPDDADDPGNFSARAEHPAQQAADAFVALLSGDGIKVTGTPAEQAVPHASQAQAQALASVSSPTVAAMTEQMLTESSNVIAENLARHVAIASGYPATFAGAAAAVTAVARRLGVSTAFRLVDGSGLSPHDQIAPASLARLLQAVVAAPRLHTVLTGLPVAGFSGTLAPGGSVFGGIGGAALGAVRAKTGNLDTVAGLAGLAYDKDGRLLAFAIMADRIVALDQAAAAITAAAASLAACGCR